MRSLLAGGAVLSLGAVGKSLAASAGTACPALPEETSGPFPADGAELHDRGAVLNVLATPGIVRQDIRPSFDTSSNSRGGSTPAAAAHVASMRITCAGCNSPTTTVV